MKKLLLPVIALAGLLMAPFMAQAAEENSLVGVQGYDLVSYHTGDKPVPGNGNNVSVYQGVSYLFANAANKETFDANPEKYVPAYGGYCAFGAAVGKKFVGDPNVYDVVDGTLYLNLDKKVQGIWSKDKAGNIAKADNNWPQIKDKKASEL